MKGHLTSAEAAEQLGVSTKTLGRWREMEADGAPAAPCVQPGGPRGPIWWRAADLEAWSHRLSAWHRRRHLRVLAGQAAPEAPAPKPKAESLYARALKRAGRER